MRKFVQKFWTTFLKWIKNVKIAKQVKHHHLIVFIKLNKIISIFVHIADIFGFSFVFYIALGLVVVSGVLCKLSFFLLLFRNDSSWRSWFCYWRFKRRRGEERLLADGYSQHWPPPTREASLPHGRWVRLYVLTFITNVKLSSLWVFDVCVCCRYAVDLVVCVALGCDMFDCVFPTRTAVSVPPPVLKDK